MTSIINRKINVNGIDSSDHAKGLMSWNKKMKEIYENCNQLNKNSCMPGNFINLSFIELERLITKLRIIFSLHEIFFQYFDFNKLNNYLFYSKRFRNYVIPRFWNSIFIKSVIFHKIT